MSLSSIDTKNPQYEYIDSTRRVEEVVGLLKNEKYLGVDTEATKLDPHSTTLLLLQVGTRDISYIIDAQKADITPLKAILENPKILKLLQNAKFDYSVLKVQAGITIENFFDTMLAEQLLTNGLVRRAASLKAIAEKYLDLKLDKDFESYNWAEVARTGRVLKKHLVYSALDTLVLFPIFEKQFELLKKENLTKIAQLEFAVAQVVSEMEVKGSYIDVARWRKLIETLRKKREEVHEKLQDEIRPLYKNHQVDLFGIVADVINLNSQPQLMELFNDKLGLNIPSTGDALLSRVDHPAVKYLREYRGVEKLISSFGEKLLAKVNPVTGRLHPDFAQLRATTGRFACSNPNLQQIPTDSAFRSCFRAPKGWKLITADYSQAELRIMAESSKDPVFVKAYREDQDLHTLTASEMYGVPMDKVDKKMRFNAKSINFGLMYGRGAHSLARQLEVSPQEAEKLLNAYFSRYRKVKAWLDKVGKQAAKQGVSHTIGGRKRWYRLPDQSDPNYLREIGKIEREGKNTPIQGTSADITKYAMVYVFRRLRAENIEAYIIHTVHDEIVVEAKEPDATKVKKIVEEEMNRAWETLIKQVPGKSEAVVSDIWEH
ncbi:MAG: DNA polymerase [bacterium]